jgi:putative PIN family toxin of toxin-antitoxin system
MKAERVVVDTNVLISALLQPSGRTAEILMAIRTAGGALLFSDETFEELASRLMRPKFDRYVDQASRQEFLADLAGVADWVAIAGAVRACRDPDDDKVLETAINGEADGIITGDADLLALDPFAGMRIMTPREFLDAVRGSATADMPDVASSRPTEGRAE